MPANCTISHEIANLLRDEILRQQYRSGERMPSERDLASRFNASRGAVREALSQIEQLGLIRIQPGGARVQPIDSASIAILGPLLALEARPDAGLVDQFLQTFGALAALTARSAIEQADGEQLQNVKEMVVALSRHGEDFEAMQPQWQELLEYLATISNNLVVRLIGNHLRAQFVEQMMKLGIKPNPGPHSTQKMLNALSQCIKSRDGDLAATAMQKHFDELRAAVASTISEMTEPLRSAAI